MFKDNDEDNQNDVKSEISDVKRSKICSKWTIKTLERRQ